MSAFKVLTLNNIASEGLDRLPRDKYEVASEIRFSSRQHPQPLHLAAPSRRPPNLQITPLSRTG